MLSLNSDLLLIFAFCHMISFINIEFTYTLSHLPSAMLHKPFDIYLITLIIAHVNVISRFEIAKEWKKKQNKEREINRERNKILMLIVALWYKSISNRMSPNRFVASAFACNSCIIFFLFGMIFSKKTSIILFCF